MALKTNFEIEQDIAKITLEGRLDAYTTPQFQDEVNKAIANKLTNLVLFVKDLEYLSSSGLRVLIFYKQNMGPDVTIIFVSPLPFVREVLQMTGFHYGLTITDNYP